MRRLGPSLCCVLALSGVGVAASTQDARAMIAEVVRTGAVIVSGIGFDPAATAPSASSEPALRQIRAMLIEHEEWRFEVQVHTDDGGDRERDRALARARAEAVAGWLAARGIAPLRLVARGYGSARPLGGPAGREAPGAVDRVELKKLNEE